MPLDVQVDDARAAAERLLLARVVADGRMPVLGADLAREQDELLRAHAVRVDVDDDLHAGLLEPAEPEVGHLDRVSLVGREDDAGVGQHRRGALPSLGMSSSCSASSVRAWPSASSRPSRSSASPRIASLTFSSSRRYESSSLELDALDAAVAPQLDHRDDAVPRVVEEERALAADRLQLVPVRQRGAAVERRDHVVREAQQPAEDPVGAGRPVPRLAVHATGSPPRRRDAADAVAADVHERAALDVGAQADVVHVVQRVRERGPDDAQLADRALRDELASAASSAGCGGT